MLMATLGESPTLFLRKATGLVKGWSKFDAFVYSFMSVNFVTLGLFFSLAVIAYVPSGQVLPSLLISGVFITFIVITALLAGFLVALGMETYAKIQRICFYIGLAGLAVVVLVMLFGSRSGFESAFNSQATSLFGTPGGAYDATIKFAGGAAALPK